MKRTFLFCFLALIGFLHAQGPYDPNEGARLTSGSATGTYLFSWFGHAGNTYFIQESEDLNHWSYIPVIESGSNQVISWGFSSTNPIFFLRLKYTNVPTSDPFNADFDGDGVSNWNELLQGTDPLSANMDTNGLPYDWETFFNIPFQTNSNTLALNGSGLTLLQCYQQKKNPVISFSLISSLYTSSQSVTLTPGQGQILYYTLDGSDPTSSPTRILVTSPTTLNFTTSSLLQIIAINGGVTSHIASISITVDQNEASLDLYNRRPKYLLRPVL